MPVRAWRFKSSHPHSETAYPARGRGGAWPPSCSRATGSAAARRRRPRSSSRSRLRRSRSFGRSLQSASHASYLRRIEAEPERARAAHPVERSRARRSAGATARRRRLRGRPPDSRGAAARARPGRRRGLAEPRRTTRLAVTSRGPQQIGADKLWGPTLATAGPGDEDRDHRRRHRRRAHPYFDPAGFQYPPGFPKGLTKYTTPKVIVQRTFAPAGADVQVRDAARSTRRNVVPRDARRRDRRRRPRHAGAGRPHLGRRAERLPRQLQGADDPDARLRPRRELRRRSPLRSRRPSPTG